MTLDKILSKARALEASETQAKGMEDSVLQSSVNPSESVKHIRKTQYPRRPTQSRPQPKSSQCRQCGLSWPHTKNPCPAKGKTCNKCGKPNHFAKMCLSGRRIAPVQGQHKHERRPKQTALNRRPDVNYVSTAPEEENEKEESSSDDEYIFTLGHEPGKTRVPETNVEINGVEMKMMIDTGASTDIMDEAAFQKIKQAQLIKLTEDRCRIFAYGSQSRLSVLGKFDAIIRANGKQVSSTVHVLQGTHGSLLSYATASELGLVDIKINNIMSCSSLIEQYLSVFQGIGKLKDCEVKLHIDKTVPPVAQSARRIPFHLRKKVSVELKKLEQQGIIEKVEGPTPWVSPLVVIPKKNGDVRLCVDMRMPNQAIQRERHPSPTVDDLVDALNGATIFSKLDLRSGYHQLSLAPESRYVTTFATHEGLRRYKRLNFGTNSASEIFQHIISEQIRDIPGSINISDDIIVFGKTKQIHDQALHAVLQQFADVGLTISPEKCELNRHSLTFFGLVFSAKGVSPDPKKVKAIHDAPPPTSVSEVRSFLGMVTYCAKFLPNFSDITKPLRELTKRDTVFRWKEEQNRAFRKVKQMLTSDTVMAYFDKEKHTELTTDASPWGLSAILSQRTPGQEDRRIVAYVSRSLTPVEQRYSQTEREALAIVWAVERLHMYLYGGHFTLHTDCKPVELILNNAKSRPPARIERWNLRLQEYHFSNVHTKGRDNPSDFLSRHPSPDVSSVEQESAEQYVRFIATHSTPKAMSLVEIQQATKADKTLQKLIELIHTNEWAVINEDSSMPDVNVAELKLFSRVREELTVNETDDLILRGTRIVIPGALRQQTLSLAHEGHQGIVKTKQLLQEKIWFPKIDHEVESLLASCLAC